MNDRTDPRFLWSPYAQGVDELIAARFPSASFSAFFIGGGAYTLPRAWAARYPRGRFTVAEVDPAVTQVAMDHMWYAPDARTTILHGEARRILQQTPREAKFDVIFGDAFHDIAIPQHLVTNEFHREVAARLTSASGPRRNWAQVPVTDMIGVVGAGGLAFLTDDHAPVDRLLRGVPQN